MYVRDLIDDAKRYVVGYYEDDDEQYIHWTEEDWMSYVRRAVGIVALADQDLFTKQMDIPLVAGSVQSIPDVCRSVKSVRGFRNEDGSLNYIRKKSSASLKLPKPRREKCVGITKGDTAYQVKSYTLDPDDEKLLIVDPPVPAGFDGVLAISCYGHPTISSYDEELPFNETHATAVFELVLYYAWGVDIEDQANRERSNTHWANALKLLEITDNMIQRQLRREARRGN